CGDHRRGIGGEVVLGFPENLTASLREANHASAVGAADARNQTVAENHGRCGVTVLGCAGHFAVLTEKCRAEIVGKIDAPNAPARAIAASPPRAAARPGNSRSKAEHAPANAKATCRK